MRESINCVDDLIYSLIRRGDLTSAQKTDFINTINLSKLITKMKDLRLLLSGGEAFSIVWPFPMGIGRRQRDNIFHSEQRTILFNAFSGSLDTLITTKADLLGALACKKYLLPEEAEILSNIIRRKTPLILMGNENKEELVTLLYGNELYSALYKDALAPEKGLVLDIDKPTPEERIEFSNALITNTKDLLWLLREVIMNAHEAAHIHHSKVSGLDIELGISSAHIVIFNAVKHRFNTLITNIDDLCLLLVFWRLTSDQQTELFNSVKINLSSFPRREEICLKSDYIYDLIMGQGCYQPNSLPPEQKINFIEMLEKSPDRITLNPSEIGFGLAWKGSKIQANITIRIINLFKSESIKAIYCESSGKNTADIFSRLCKEKHPDNMLIIFRLQIFALRNDENAKNTLNAIFRNPIFNVFSEVDALFIAKLIDHLATYENQNGFSLSEIDEILMILIDSAMKTLAGQAIAIAFKENLYEKSPTLTQNINHLLYESQPEVKTTAEAASSMPAGMFFSDPKKIEVASAACAGPTPS